MWLNRLGNFFTDSDHKFSRDYLLRSLAVVFLATIGANFLARSVGSDPSDDITTQKIAVVASGQKVSRTYTEVKSVLDGNIGNSSLTTIDQQANNRSVLDDEIVTGSTVSKSNSIRLDPCKIQAR